MMGLQITQHKRFVSYGTHPNFCFAKTSFRLESFGETVALKQDDNNEEVI